MTATTTSRSQTAWRILLSLAVLAVIAALGALPTLIGPPSENGLLDLAKFTGRFHPVVLHLPIGILIWVLVHECLVAFGLRQGSSRTAMGLAAGTALIASLLGTLLYYSMPEYDAELAQRHMDRGIAFTCLALAAWLVKIWVDAAAGRGAFIYRGLLLGSAGVMTVASHDGASLTHGSTYLTEYAPAPLRKLLGMPEKSSAAPEPGDLEMQPVYQAVIAPIFEAKCYQCHNADRQRGKYRMDGYELLLAGGNDGAAITPGDSAASNLVKRIELPEEDELHMPPEGKKDLAAHEVTLIKWWIDQGASADAPLNSLTADDEVLAALAMVSDAAPAVAKGGAPVKPDASAMNDAIKAAFERLREEFPAALNYESQSSSGLTFTAAGLRASFGDADLAKLEPVLPAIVSMDLAATSLTDDGAKLLAKATALKSLRLSETAVTEASLDTLVKLTELESLNLYGTQIGSPAVLKLGSLQKLKKLYLWRTQVDAAGVLQLQEKLPGCEIVMGL
ncbi:MAG: c-type cytochrome domain-containing protein [Luteolibacter sp.]